MAPPATTREEAQDRAVYVNGVIGSPAYPVPEAGGAPDRRPAASTGRTTRGRAARQLLADAGVRRPHRGAALESPRRRWWCTGSRTRWCRWPAGRATAEAVPGAEILEVPGMGHNLPPQLWGTLVERIVAHLRAG